MAINLNTISSQIEKEFPNFLSENESLDGFYLNVLLNKKNWLNNKTIAYKTIEDPRNTNRFSSNKEYIFNFNYTTLPLVILVNKCMGSFYHSYDKNEILEKKALFILNNLDENQKKEISKQTITYSSKEYDLIDYINENVDCVKSRSLISFLKITKEFNLLNDLDYTKLLKNVIESKNLDALIYLENNFDKFKPDFLFDNYQSLGQFFTSLKNTNFKFEKLEPFAEKFILNKNINDSVTKITKQKQTPKL